MEIFPGDRLTMKKKHPCGCNMFTVLRSGMDIKIRCDGCGKEVMVSRFNNERNIKSIEHSEDKKQV